MQLYQKMQKWGEGSDVKECTGIKMFRFLDYLLWNLDLIQTWANRGSSQGDQCRTAQWLDGKGWTWVRKAGQWGGCKRAQVSPAEGLVQGSAVGTKWRAGVCLPGKPKSCLLNNQCSSFCAGKLPRVLTALVALELQVPNCLYPTPTGF